MLRRLKADVVMKVWDAIYLSIHPFSQPSLVYGSPFLDSQDPLFADDAAFQVQAFKEMSTPSTVHREAGPDTWSRRKTHTYKWPYSYDHL